MSDLFPVTLGEQIAEVQNEINMRRSVYARRVTNKAMTQVAADKQIARMQAVLATLNSLKEKAVG